MKTHIVSSLLAAALLTGASFAQAPAGTGSSTSATAATKPLGETDKKFLKDAAEAIVSVRQLSDSTKWGSPAGEALKKINADITKDLDEAWGELAPMADSRKVNVPKEASAADKAAVAKLKKDTRDFDKNFLKSLNKETKKAQKVFEAGEKSVQDADVKAFVTKWSPKVKAHADEVAKAEDEASKRK